MHLGALEKVTLQLSKNDKGLGGRKMGPHNWLLNKMGFNRSKTD